MKYKENLLDYLNEIGKLYYVVGILKWEMDTTSPKESYEYLIDVKNDYEYKIFEMTTSSKYIKLLNDYINSKEFEKSSKSEKEFILSLKEDYNKFKKIPKDFYKKYTKLSDNSLNAWVEAKDKKDYSIFKPYLEKIIKMTKQYYLYMYPNEKNLYEKMINEYEKGLKLDDIDKLFEELKQAILPIIKNLNVRKIKEINKKYSESEMKDISKFLLEYIGFDLSRGSLGTFTHPYTVKINNDDIRITFSTNDNIISHFSSVIHEGGHGIFEQNIDKSLRKYGIYEINKIALHESQSRFYENILGRNKNFWVPIYKDIKKKLNFELNLDEFIDTLNNAKPSLIRTEADELTYCMHIIIRYEIEKAIFNGKIDIDDLPDIWNKKYEEYLGVKVKNDSEGILQDMHWSDGSFGYFPTYLLGTIFDGMLIELINEKLGNINNLLKEGKIKEITKFLNKNIHKYGGTYNIMELSKKICKKELGVEPIIKYFKDKYE